MIKTLPNLPRADFDLRKVLREKLRCLLPLDVELFCSPKIRVERGLPAQVITRVAESETASLIIVGLGNRALLAASSPWSTLSDVISEARCGVLIVRVVQYSE